MILAAGSLCQPARHRHVPACVFVTCVSPRHVNEKEYRADSSHVPSFPFRFSVPDRCRKCDAEREVTLQASVADDVAVLSWFCARCQHEWPVTEAERRTGTPDRRRYSRTDRRARN